MLTGKRFKLDRDTLAVDSIDGKRRAVKIPAGSIIQVASGPNNGDGMVNIHWEGRIIEMFEVDVNVRGTEIRDQSANA
jgi:hypothetical protein